MKTNYWRYCVPLVLSVLVAVCVSGCRRSKSKSSDTVVVVEGEGAPAAGAAADTPITMRARTLTVPAETVRSVGVGRTPADGKVVAMANWDGGGYLVTYMRVEGSVINIGWARGQSPLTITASNIDKDTSIVYYIYNETVADKSVSYTVVLDPS